MQKIYKYQYNNLDDINPVPYKFSINIVNSAQFPIKMSITPISYELYNAFGYPWYKLYDEKLEDIEVNESLNKK